MNRLSIFLFVGLLFGQTGDDWEIPVVSVLVGTTIDIPEQEYYAIFDNVDEFLTGQFMQKGDEFIATIRTAEGLSKRRYSARQFYDIGLSIDLLGDIDPIRLAFLRGEPHFAETMEKVRALMTDVIMTIHRRDGKAIKGRYRGLNGHHFEVRGRRGRDISRISIGEIDYLMYRDPPVIDVKGDKRIFRIMAALGMVSGFGADLILGVDDFNTRGGHFFIGGLAGLALAPIPIRQVRRLRGGVHRVDFDKQIIDRVRTYLFLEYGES